MPNPRIKTPVNSLYNATLIDEWDGRTDTSRNVVVQEGWKCWRLYHHLLLLSLFAEGSSAHLEHGFEALATFDGVLLELRDGRLLHGILDLLPSSAHSRDLGLLLELCLEI